VTIEPMRTRKQSKVQNLLGKAAGGCGGALHSFLAVVGDRYALHATGQYSTDVKAPIVRRRATSGAEKRRSSQAADGDVHTHGRPTAREDRVMRAQREETAFMTLICHECAAATASPTGNSVGPVGRL
jgi:hypothetical protein